MRDITEKKLTRKYPPPPGTEEKNRHPLPSIIIPPRTFAPSMK